MEYNQFQYLYPPRPDNAIKPELLGFYEKRGWIAQIKKNGTSNVIAVSPDKQLICMNRHNEVHKQWKPTENSSKAFTNIPGSGWYVFTAELLHSKVVGLRDTNYVHDILVADSNYLVGTTFAERQHILNDLFRPVGENEHYRLIDNHTWLANLHTKNFHDLYKSLDSAEDEGLVLKDPKAKLALCSREKSNNTWQVKSRKSTKNFGF